MYYNCEISMFVNYRLTMILTLSEIDAYGRQKVCAVSVFICLWKIKSM